MVFIKISMRSFFNALFLAPLSIIILGGCAVIPTAPRMQRLTGNNALKNGFIVYWPPHGGGKQLRLAVKDNIDMKGVVTSVGSEYLLKNRPPAAQDAECLAIARQRHVQIVGKTLLSEFAVAPSGTNDYFGTPKSPLSTWRPLIPGGSSCGSALAVAKGKADVAFGTDTAGSVRVPAACCGVVGLKTTHGLVSVKGVFPIEPKHLDTVGPIARDIAHTVKGMDLLQNGFAERYEQVVADKPSAQGIRIGRLSLRGTDSRVDQAVDAALARAHFQVVPLDEEFAGKWERAKKDGNTVAAAGAWISGKEYRNKLGVTAHTQSAILVGSLLYERDYLKAPQRQAGWQKALREVFKKVDFIALPTLQTTPPPIPAIGKIGALEVCMLGLQNTVAVNFAGNPALAMPVPMKHGGVRVTSLQLIGPRLSEAELLNAGRFIEASRK